jgi:hypothetical protein
MSQRRRTPYKPPRDRRELAIAVLSAVAVIAVTAVLVWVFRPNKDLGSTGKPQPTFTAPTDVPGTVTPTSAPPSS